MPVHEPFSLVLEIYPTYFSPSGRIQLQKSIIVQVQYESISYCFSNLAIISSYCKYRKKRCYSYKMVIETTTKKKK